VRTLSMKVPEALDHDLGVLAERRGVSKSALIRDAMTELVTRERAGADRAPAGSFLAMAEDLAGCVEAAEDLSTNKSYLDDYGR
jgi:predicted transcriptional regulator